MLDSRVRPDAMCSFPTLCTVPAFPASQCRRGANRVVFRSVVCPDGRVVKCSEGVQYRVKQTRKEVLTR